MIRFSVVSTEIFRGASIPIPPKLFAAASGQVDRRTYSAPRKKSTGEDADKQNGDTLRYTFFFSDNFTCAPRKLRTFT